MDIKIIASQFASGPQLFEKDSCIQFLAQLYSTSPEATKFVRDPMTWDLKRELEISQGIAIIDISGPLFQHDNFWTRYFGATSYEGLQSEIRMAMESEEVDGVLLKVSSPGGSSFGCADLSDYIASCNEEKPFVAYTDSMAASAGYWLPAATSKLFVSQTALVGSIGVVWPRYDFSEYNKKAGIAVHLFHAGAAKIDMHPDKKMDKEEEKRVNELVSSLYEIFASSVAQNRGLSIEEVKATEAQLFTGQKGVDAGLADAVTTLDGALAEARELVAERGRRGAMPKENTETKAEATQAVPVVEAVAEPAKELSAEASQALIEQGAKAERQRISDIEAATVVGGEELAAQAKAEGWTVAEFAVKQGKAVKTTEAQAKNDALANLKADAQSLDEVEATPAPEAEAKPATEEGQWIADFNKNPDLQAEFGKSDRYVHYKELEKKGLIR